MEHVQITSPWLIMAINMTIVFAVLISLGVLMKIIYLIDPTRKKQEKEQKAAVSKAAETPAPAAQAAPAQESNSDEVIAAITAAVTAMGYSATQIATVRPRTSKKWSYEGRLTGRM